MNKPISIIVPLLVFVLFVDLEANFLAVQSQQGERVAAASELVGDALVQRGELSVGIKSSDLLLALGAMLLFVNLILCRIQVFSILRRPYIYLIIFIIFGMYSFVENSSLFQHSQLIIGLLYSIKLLEISLIFPLIQAYQTLGYDDRRIIIAIMFATFLGGIIGLINIVTPIFNNILIFDRPSFYGPLVLSALYLMHIYATPALRARYSLPASSYLVVASVAIAAATFCGKRSVVLGLVIGLLALLWPILRRNPLFCLIVVVPLLGIGGNEFIYKTFFTVEGPIFEGIGPQLSQTLQKLPDTVLAQLQGLDYSTRSRMGRIAYGILAATESPVIGFGLNSAPFVGYLPDNLYTALLFETGVIGSLLAAVFFVSLWRNLRPLKVLAMFGGVRAIFLAFFAMGVGMNSMNTFSFFAIFLALCAISMGWHEEATRRPAPRRAPAGAMDQTTAA